ncbi:hypothetical protein SAMN02910298_01960 [Pseudobutyrivibrio sp. YE44]|uniref:hypothetical protein n=1 Tax=Pseudobutyrivibrio sp. YE44 TaxID=1520802 RepID=UPI000884B224|nr:hypothetical protein [Pseudobutyrivibrio sp. YE44]SDB40119.1 hypothetical protein SAMN02910298_01960 [Pseudobutyrivibrio sp. YE44]
MDKSNYVCSCQAQDLFCDLELYIDSCSLEIRLLLFKHIVIKKWKIPKNELILSWVSTIEHSPNYQGSRSFIGFMLLDGSVIVLPMLDLIWWGFPEYVREYIKVIKVYRAIIEEVISIGAIGMSGTKEYGIDIPGRYYGLSFSLSDAKKYKKWLSQIYNETKQPGDNPEDVYTRMKENNIQGKLLDKLQNDGFIYNRKYTWDKVYKRENE